MTFFIPRSNNLSSLAKTWTYFSSDACLLSSVLQSCLCCWGPLGGPVSVWGRCQGSHEHRGCMCASLGWWESKRGHESMHRLFLYTSVLRLLAASACAQCRKATALSLTSSPWWDGPLLTWSVRNSTGELTRLVGVFVWMVRWGCAVVPTASPTLFFPHLLIRIQTSRICLN